MKRNYYLIVENYQLDPGYDPDRCRNGGCYPKPTIEGRITWDGCRKPIRFLINDDSCGDFGKRYYIEFQDGPKEMCGYYSTNEIDYDGTIPDESTFTLNRAIIAIRELLEEETGFWFRTKEELDTQE